MPLPILPWQQFWTEAAKVAAYVWATEVRHHLAPRSGSSCPPCLADRAPSEAICVADNWQAEALARCREKRVEEVAVEKASCHTRSALEYTEYREGLWCERGAWLASVVTGWTLACAGRCSRRDDAKAGGSQGGGHPKASGGRATSRQAKGSSSGSGSDSSMEHARARARQISRRPGAPAPPTLRRSP